MTVILTPNVLGVGDESNEIEHGKFKIASDERSEPAWTPAEPDENEIANRLLGMLYVPVTSYSPGGSETDLNPFVLYVVPARVAVNVPVP